MRNPNAFILTRFFSIQQQDPDQSAKGTPLYDGAGRNSLSQPFMNDAYQHLFGSFPSKRSTMDLNPPAMGSNAEPSSKPSLQVSAAGHDMERSAVVLCQVSSCRVPLDSTTTVPRYRRYKICLSCVRAPEVMHLAFTSFCFLRC